MKPFNDDMERIRWRYGDPHTITEDDGLEWNYFDPEHTDVPKLIVVFDRGRLANILELNHEKKQMSMLYPIPNPDDHRAAVRAAELLDEAGRLTQEGNRDGALDCLQKAAEAAPAYADAWYWLGVELLQRADFQKALGPLNRALELDPRNLAARFQLAIASFNARDRQRARDLSARLLQMSPDSIWHVRARELCRLAEHALAGGDPAELMARTKQPVAQTPPAAKEVLGTTLQMQEDQLPSLVRAFPDSFGEEFQQTLREFVAGLLKKRDRDTNAVLAARLNMVGVALKRASNRAAEPVCSATPAQPAATRWLAARQTTWRAYKSCAAIF